MVVFKTKLEALRAGWTSVNRKNDRDVSGYPYFGYEYQNENGQRSKLVWLSNEKNKMGDMGAFISMYPPKK